MTGVIREGYHGGKALEGWGWGARARREEGRKQDECGVAKGTPAAVTGTRLGSVG